MEIIQKEPFLVVVDYAHTPGQLEKVYQTLQASSFKLPASKLICVLGSCGGGRDKWKRPVLGKIAAQYCKEIIITNEDPYDENPLSIMTEIANGIKNLTPNTQHLILDRREAIKKAISLAKPGDAVIITGKGSEPWMCIENGRKIPWDDRQIAKKYCISRAAKGC
jgi:UDP-N-acetylmuramyl tripeptide synthase